MNDKDMYCNNENKFKFGNFINTRKFKELLVRSLDITLYLEEEAGQDGDVELAEVYSAEKEKLETLNNILKNYIFQESFDLFNLSNILIGEGIDWCDREWIEKIIEENLKYNKNEIKLLTEEIKQYEILNIDLQNLIQNKKGL